MNSQRMFTNVDRPIEVTGEVIAGMPVLVRLRPSNLVLANVDHVDPYGTVHITLVMDRTDVRLYPHPELAPGPRLDPRHDVA